MPSHPKILVVEDSEADYRLMLRELAGLTPAQYCRRVDSREALLGLLSDESWDLVLADHHLPGMLFGEALAAIRQHLPDVPVILVSGGLGEEAAVEWMKQGVADFVLKHRMSRLVPAIRRCLQEAEERSSRHMAEMALRESEARFRATFEQAAIGIAHVALDGRLQWSNRKLEDILACPVGGRRGEDARQLVVDADRPAARRIYRQLVAGRVPQAVRELRLLAGDGSPVWCNLTLSLARSAGGAPSYLIVMVEDIRERKRIEQELATALADARRADQAKSRFLAAASHDLRQPAQSMVMFVALLHRKLQGSPLEPAVVQLESAVGALTDMLGGLLDISRLDAGAVEVHKVPVDVQQVLAKLTDEYVLRAEARGLALRQGTRRPRHAVTDPMLLERILRNLVENALRYTEQGGVLLGCRSRGQALRLEVIDSGVGVAPDQQPLIFEELYQVGNAARDRAQGLGLGLAIVSRMASLIGARVELDSRLGHGSRFALILPAERAPPREPPRLPAPPPAPKRSLLVVDDDPVVRRSIQMALESFGYRVLAAASRAEAVALMTQGDGLPDALIADYRLGQGETGPAVAVALREHLGWAIPVLVMTGDTAPDRIREVRESGFGILSKPVGVDELLEAVERTIAGAGRA